MEIGLRLRMIQYDPEQLSTGHNNIIFHYMQLRQIFLDDSSKESVFRTYSLTRSSCLDDLGRFQDDL